jgi:hypothetical protein
LRIDAAAATRGRRTCAYCGGVVPPVVPDPVLLGVPGAVSGLVVEVPVESLPVVPEPVVDPGVQSVIEPRLLAGPFVVPLVLPVEPVVPAVESRGPRAQASPRALRRSLLLVVVGRS